MMKSRNTLPPIVFGNSTIISSEPLLMLPVSLTRASVFGYRASSGPEKARLLRISVMLWKTV
jgi:hypothetical protein